MQEVFRILGHICETTEEGKRGGLLWKLAASSILMAALKIGKPNIYDRLGNQTLEPPDGFELLKNLLGEDRVGWWFKFILTGNGFKMEEDDSLEEIMKKVGLPMDENLHNWHGGWGELPYPYSSRFVQIYEKIEQISQWD